MYALVLSDNIFTSSFLSRGLRYENVQSLPFSFHHFNPQSINMSEFDCAVVKIDGENKNLPAILDSIPNKPLYLIKPSKVDIHIEKKNIIIANRKTTIRQLAFDMKKRINKQIRNNDENFIKVADLSLDLKKRTASRFNKTIILRNKEFHLLEFLMRNTGSIYSRQNLLEQVWDRNANMFTNTIDVHINILRRKLDYKDEFRLIETIHCHGYIMHKTPFR
jgi:DNA-binding winged helix-turn-helix (wHTH) protein